MAGNPGVVELDSPFGALRLLAPLPCDVAMVHAPLADRRGNVVMTGPSMDGVWAAWAARRGALVTVERVVDDVSAWNHLVRIPAHRVLAVIEAPFGAHPGGLHAPSLPVTSYGEDLRFWADVAAACRTGDERWAQDWCVDVVDHDAYLAKLGNDRLNRLLPGHDRPPNAEATVDHEVPISTQERVAVLSSRELFARIEARAADALLAGAGVSNLAAWMAAARAQRAGRTVRLAADLGMWGYVPAAGDPLIFGHRTFGGAEMLTDGSMISGLVVGGPGTTAIGALAGAQVDRFGNVNSTDIRGTSFYGGSGGAADVAARAAECVVSVPADRRRLVRDVDYVTSPGANVVAACTDLGVLRKGTDGELVLAAVPAGELSLRSRVQCMVDACGWELSVGRELVEVPAVTLDDVLELRAYDPERLFLR
jgi:acyl CoA:acetate/3-ketoacid CoA transferase beta subunit